MHIIEENVLNVSIRCIEEEHQTRIETIKDDKIISKMTTTKYDEIYDTVISVDVDPDFENLGYIRTLFEYHVVKNRPLLIDMNKKVKIYDICLALHKSACSVVEPILIVNGIKSCDSREVFDLFFSDQILDRKISFKHHIFDKKFINARKMTGRGDELEIGYTIGISNKNNP